jgi:hypothetical protein
MALGQLLLERCVGAGRLGIGAQLVSEREEDAERR